VLPDRLWKFELMKRAGSGGTGGTSRGSRTGPLAGVPKLQLSSSTAAAKLASSSSSIPLPEKTLLAVPGLCSAGPVEEWNREKPVDPVGALPANRGFDGAD
jgi:hypothetical protein